MQVKLIIRKKTNRRWIFSLHNSLLAMCHCVFSQCCIKIIQAFLVREEQRFPALLSAITNKGKRCSFSYCKFKLGKRCSFGMEYIPSAGEIVKTEILPVQEKYFKVSNFPVQGKIGLCSKNVDLSWWPCQTSISKKFYTIQTQNEFKTIYISYLESFTTICIKSSSLVG